MSLGVLAPMAGARKPQDCGNKCLAEIDCPRLGDSFADNPHKAQLLFIYFGQIRASEVFEARLSPFREGQLR
jgi:hypothetical protein